MSEAYNRLIDAAFETGTLTREDAALQAKISAAFMGSMDSWIRTDGTVRIPAPVDPLAEARAIAARYLP